MVLFFIQNEVIYIEVFTLKHRNIELNILKMLVFKAESLVDG